MPDNPDLDSLPIARDLAGLADPDRVLPRLDVTGLARLSKLGTIITDFAVARKVSCDQEDDGITIWGDLRNRIAAEAAITHQSEFRHPVRLWCLHLLGNLHAKGIALGREEIGEISNDMTSDFRFIFLAATAPTPAPEAQAFARRLHDAYKNGGWPCGWNGKYPDGDMLIYARVS